MKSMISLLLLGFTSFLVCACSNPLSSSSILPPGFHPGISGISGVTPIVTSVLPSSGPAAGGTLITVNGTSFLAGLSVQVGGQSCGSVNLISSTQLKCVTSSHVAGENAVTVTNIDTLSGQLANAFYFLTPGTTSPSFANSSGGGFSAAGNIRLRGTASAVGSSVQTGGNVRAYSGVQSVLVKP